MTAARIAGDGFMNPLSLKRWTMLLVTLILPFVYASCRPEDAPGTPTPVIEEHLPFGPGPFDLPDPMAGLSDLSSYTATLTLAFDGTNAGQPSTWSKTYVMLGTKDPAAHLLSIEKTGDLSDLDAVFMAEMDGADYERIGDGSCLANAVAEGGSLTSQMEPAGFLPGVIGADAAGSETVNDVAADHYTFDERAMGELGLAQSRGEVWVASEGGYVVKYLLATTGNADYFGEEIEGTLTWAYELTGVNQPLTPVLPPDCPAGMVDAPRLPDALIVLNMPSVLSYKTSSSPAEAAAFYQQQLPAAGWEPFSEPAVTDTTALLRFREAGQTLSVTVTVDVGVTTVYLVLQRSQE
jgi:hypothetical protein